RTPGTGPGSGGLNRAARAGACLTALERAALLLAHAAPHTGVLAGFEGPREALARNGAACADRLGFLNLRDRRAARADREEQFRILVAANGTMAPVHYPTPHWVRCAPSNIDQGKYVRRNAFCMFS